MNDNAKEQAYLDFNKQLKSLINDLLSVYPDVIEIKLFKAGFKVLKKISKKKPQHVFNMTFALPYKEKIDARDSKYFESDDFKIEYCTNLKTIWIHMDEINKKHVWDHLSILMVKNELCNKFHKNGPLIDSSDEEL